ncbi:FAD-dependent oxidoreductase [Novipirellula sp. SH528]|uniref:FAD-dependent oxidoreductase n=1 Tax=Novipirellula sp. SH528 TaxID=3454466 RepID=UPI003F9FCC22
MMSDANQGLGQHAIVIGGSISGLLTASVLIRHFQRVTIVERDNLSDDGEPRKGVPQGSHVHVIFSGGMRVIDQLFPGFSDELAASGAVVCDFSRDLCWYHAGVWKSRPKSNLKSYWQTRPFLEAHLRRRMSEDAGIQIEEGASVVGLLADPERTRITGVEIRWGSDDETQSIDADLVVDASGRGSQTPKWIESLGYVRPKEIAVQVNIGYASRDCEPSQDDARDWKIMALYGTPPLNTRTGYVFPIEGNRWRVSQVGFLNDTPPADEEAYLEFAKSLERPDFYEAIKDARPLSPIASFKFPADKWRRYDQLSRFPAGLLVIGDAISTFNPVYGQGMSASALEVDELRQVLECQPHGKGIPADLYRTFFRRSAKVIKVPWLLATQSDFLYPQTTGRRDFYTNALNWYLVRMLRLCSGNDRITKTFYEVLHFIKKPSAFFHPQILSRVLARSLGFSGSSRSAKDRPRLP